MKLVDKIPHSLRWACRNQSHWGENLQCLYTRLHTRDRLRRKRSYRMRGNCTVISSCGLVIVFTSLMVTLFSLKL